jgi:hypothetical protein
LFAFIRAALPAGHALVECCAEVFDASEPASWVFDAKDVVTPLSTQLRL